MGYCPFSALGRETAGGVATGRARHRVSSHACTIGPVHAWDMALGAQQVF